MAHNNGKQLFIGMLLGSAVLGSGPALTADKYMGTQNTAAKDTGAKDGSMNDWGTPAEFYNSIGDEQTTGKTNIQVISINGLLRF